MAFFIKPTIPLWSFSFPYYISSWFVYFFMDFVSSFIYYCHYFQLSILYISCYHLVEFFFISFLLVYQYPVSLLHFFSLLTYLKFQSNFDPHSKMDRFYFMPSHTSHNTNSLAIFLSIQMWTIWLHSVLSGDIQVTFWMSLCWYHLPVTAKSLPSAIFTIRFPLWFSSLWRLCPPHAEHN